MKPMAIKVEDKDELLLFGKPQSFSQQPQLTYRNCILGCFQLTDIFASSIWASKFIYFEKKCRLATFNVKF